MLSKETLYTTLIGNSTVDTLISSLCHQTPDFSEILQRFIESMERLKDSGVEVDKYVTAVMMKCASNMFFAGILGIKMNYEHFRNPMTPNCTWPQIDFDDFLRVDLAYYLPMHDSATLCIEDLDKSISENINYNKAAIIEFESALEVYGLKLAHYFGYLAGNDFLPHCIPGYRPDDVLTLQYTHMLEDYFGSPIYMDQWNGIPSCISIPPFSVLPEVLAKESDLRNSILSGFSH